MCMGLYWSGLWSTPNPSFAMLPFFYFLVGVVGGVRAAGHPHAKKFGVWRAVALDVFRRINVFVFLYSVSASMQQSLEFGGQY